MAISDDDKSQIDKFREAARELETDNDEARFDATLERIAKVPPPKDEKPKKEKPGQ
ncbi:DNA-binding protein [Aurantimonas sp. C2-6-R+9]|uniref:DNA-binding protein n=1 Tax=unclassified Aurantimonas TaxID=2638230 RepID=UPI002E16C80A|nr:MULTISPECIES: DNA-binding protein [unclassified Aurantimonas]MEC5292949.1 DNA-binding protein [Aurantimonas sp. C2-3-R2]MEC5383899.1 DNA-binding protein [Aurantimonas sp. C2-6-R+9]MEC5413974.1 DNA-binding protein [Aurantimonas sp. C2-4-R8]